MFGGQPGSGKSASIADALQVLAAYGGAAQIIGDDLRADHPKYAQLMADDDQTAAFYTDRDSGRWVERAIVHASLRRYNVVLEGTFRQAEVVASTMKRFREEGYRVDARALAVSRSLSTQGIHARYEAQRETFGHGRMTTPKSHQESYDGMLITVERIEQEKLADSLTLYRRGAEQIYENTLIDGEWAKPPEARKVLVAERNRRWSVAERLDYDKEWTEILGTMRARGATTQELRVAVAASRQHNAMLTRRSTLTLSRGSR